MYLYARRCHCKVGIKLHGDDPPAFVLVLYPRVFSRASEQLTSKVLPTSRASDSGQPRTSSFIDLRRSRRRPQASDTEKRLRREDGFQQDDPKVEGQPQHTQINYPAITKSREAHKVRGRPCVDATTTTAIRFKTVTFRSSTPRAYEPNRVSLAARQEEQAQEAKEGWSRRGERGWLW
jgi:hypothetical protein